MSVGYMGQISKQYPQLSTERDLKMHIYVPERECRSVHTRMPAAHIQTQTWEYTFLKLSKEEVSFSAIFSTFQTFHLLK